MAKNMKKTVALILALALFAGQVPVPARAADNAEPEVETPQVIVRFLEEENSEEADSQEEETGELPPEEKEAQEITTVTETRTVDPDTGAAVKTETTRTETADPEADTQVTEVRTETTTTSQDGSEVLKQNQWESQETGRESSTEQTPDGTVTTETQTSVNVEGSEEIHRTQTHDEENNLEIITDTGNGRESSEEVTETVTTTVTENQLIAEETTTETETTPTETETEETTGEWETGEVTEGSWQEGQVTEGQLSGPVTVKDETTGIDVRDSGEVTLELKPNGKEVTVDVDITAEQALAGTEIPQGAEEIIVDGKVVGYKVTETTVTSTPDADPEQGKTQTSYSEETHVATAPEGYTEGTVEETTENGKIITVTEGIRDDNGKIIGYRVTKTSVTETTESSTADSRRETETETTGSWQNMTLPQRPEESVTTNVAGNTVTVTVEDIVEDGRVVGYKTVTTVTNEKNEVLHTESDSIYGTSASGSTSVEKDPVTEEETVKTTVTTTQVQEIYATDVSRDVTLTTQRTNEIETTVVTREDTWQLEQSEDGRYYIRYQGVMYPVVEMDGHGTVDLTGLKPSAKPSSANDLANGTSITNPPSVSNTKSPTGSQFKYIDYGLISDFRVTKEDGGNTSEVHLYKLVDADGNAFYAYCADLDTTAYRNTIYNISNAKDENYYQNNQDREAYEHLQTIAANGYWGTSDGIGSMEAIRELLRRNGKDSVANSITDGEAMTATQAAIWYFGNKSSSKLVDGDNPAANVGNKTSRNNINTLFDILIGDNLKDTTSNTGTDLIDKEDIQGATLDLKGKSVDEKTGEVKKDAKGNEKYTADLSFTLAVEKNSITGNLKVIVQDENGNTLRQEWLATDDSNFLGKLLAGTTTDKGTVYTIEGLELAEGVKVDLVLDGYQNLQEGVYIYTAASGSHEDSQTFIGVAKGKRDVNLSVGMEFEAEAPEAQHIEKVTQQKRTDIRVDRKTDTRTDTRTDTSVKTDTGTETVTETNVKVYGTVTKTESQREEVCREQTWEYDYIHAVELKKDEEKPDREPDDGDKHEETQPEEDVAITEGEYPINEDPGPEVRITSGEQMPSAEVPHTGDFSPLWAAMSLISLAALVLLGRKRRQV